MFKPELLSPAGSLKNMRYAFAYGADAVYAGQPRYSLRVRNNEFSLENLAIGIKEAHALGKKFYVVSNIAPHNSKLTTFIKDLAEVVALEPDALIMSDPGLIMLVRENFPDMEIHLSVQANTVNWAAVKFWSQQGIKRVILSRELAIDEIAEIRQRCPEVELEVFVHGALCMAYSGRCLLSGYINKRDPNQGTCTNACRWEYKAQTATENETSDIVSSMSNRPTESCSSQNALTQCCSSKVAVPENNVLENNTLENNAPETTEEVYLLEESGRPGELMPAFEDEHGTYIMNSKDLRAVELVQQLTALGVHSLKIEGRTKSFYYCARTAQIYRQAIDDAVAERPFDPTLNSQLEHLANRGYTEGFLRRHRHDHSSMQNYQQGHSESKTQQFVGEILGINPDNGLVMVDVKNKFLVGDELELITPQGNQTFTLTHMENDKNQVILDAKGSGHKVNISLPAKYDLAFAILVRYLDDDCSTRAPFEHLSQNNTPIIEVK